MANLAKQSTIELAGGDLKSLLGDLGQPPEMTEMMSLLPNWVEQRQSALERIKQAYDEDPRMKISPAQAHGRAMFSNPNVGDIGSSLAAGEQARNDQAEFLRKSKIDREGAILNGLDLGAFDKLYTNVQKNLAKSKDAGKDKRQMVGSADQGWWAYNFDTGEKKLLIPGTLQQKQKAQLREVILNRLKEDGGDMTAHTNNADQLAHDIIYKFSPEEVDQYINQGGVPGAVTHGVVTEPDQPPVQITNGGIPYQKQNALPGIMDAEDPEGRLSVAQPPVHPPQEQLGAQIATAMGVQKPVAKTGVGPLIVKTPEQARFGTTTGENWANINKELEASIKANEAKLNHFAPMESMLMAGNLPSGPLHEYLKTVGDFASTYDPSGDLAKRYGNDTPAYFGSLMNLVRSDIKALGAGTAVSNLDLIVSQMAAGDLRNSPQGNLKLIGLMKYVAAEKAAHDKKYMNYIDKNGRGTGFVTGPKLAPEYALRRKPNAKGLEQYVLETRGDYEKRFEAKFNKKPSQKQWEDYSKDSVNMMFSGEEYAKR